MADTTYAATGRRKTAIARARLVAGEGRITVNE
ncbi:MAG: Ribosomal protein, partial [Verrucomicrobiales bacterium]|nr:Ribosomal protein [Verrucomicrobiales bacterium]